MEQKTRLRKHFVSYFKSNGTIVLKKHVDANCELMEKYNGKTTCK
jgi:hypothetical protein